MIPNAILGRKPLEKVHWAGYHVFKGIFVILALKDSFVLSFVCLIPTKSWNEHIKPRNDYKLSGW